MVVERDLDVSSTVIEIDALLSSAERLSVMSESAKSLGQPDTAGMVADLIEGRFS